MYHRIVRRNIIRTFDALNQHDYEAALAQFSPAITHSFPGEHALGGTRHSVQGARLWYQRLFELFPDLRFTVVNTVIAGLPGDTRIAVQFRVDASTIAGQRMAYSNDVAQFIRLRWGKITEMRLYEDTEKLVAALAVMREQGVTEAAEPPITG